MTNIFLRNSGILEYIPVIDEKLISMAMSGNSSFLNRATRKYLQEKYRISINFMNYETLEFYGDVILYTVVIDMMRDEIGFLALPGSLTRMKSGLTNNRFLNEISQYLGFCVSEKVGDKSCADRFEAILGSLYLQYDLVDLLSPLKEWLKSIDPFMEIFERFSEITYYEQLTFRLRKFPEIIIFSDLTDEENIDEYLRNFKEITLRIKNEEDRTLLTLHNSRNDDEIVIRQIDRGEAIPYDAIVDLFFLQKKKGTK